jgi:WD40 repeat protein
LDANNGKVKKILAGHKQIINDLLVVDENCLISASEDNTIKIWNINEERVEKTFTGKHVLALKNGDLVSASYNGTITIWDINNGTEKISLSNSGYGNFLSFVLLNNGDLVCGLEHGSIIIWDLDNEIVKKKIYVHSNHVIKLELLRNGDLVSGSTDYKDKTITIWNINDGNVKRTLTGHTSNVCALKELHNGDLVSVSDDKTMKIWDVESGTIKKDLKLDSIITSLTLLPNGDLVTASYESIIIWN